MKCGDKNSITVIVPLAYVKVLYYHYFQHTNKQLDLDEATHKLFLNHMASRQWRRVLSLYSENREFFKEDSYYMTRALQAAICSTDDSQLLQILGDIELLKDKKDIIIRAARCVLCQRGIDYIYRSSTILRLLQSQYRIPWVRLLFNNRYFSQILGIFKDEQLNEMTDSEREYYVESQITIGDLDLAREILLDYPMLASRYRLAFLSADIQLAGQLLEEMLNSDNEKVREYAVEVKCQFEEYYSRSQQRQTKSPDKLPRARAVTRAVNIKSEKRRRKELRQLLSRSLSRKISSLFYVKLL